MRDTDQPGNVTGSRSIVLGQQRSHLLLIFSNVEKHRESEFRNWYTGSYRESLLKFPGTLSLRQYELDETDITQGNHPPVPFKFVGICEISVDGAQQASGLIEHVSALHRASNIAEPPATWLYYPVGEKVVADKNARPAMLAIAFANSVPGQENEFREWYVTRHVRHALGIPSLVSGQCFERTQFQVSGSLASKFSMIAIYEQAGTPEELLQDVSRLPAGALDFPTLNLSRDAFSESLYRLIS